MLDRAALRCWIHRRTLLPRRGSDWVLVAAMVTFAGAILSQSHYVAIWDSWIYANCVLDAAAHPLQFDRYSCAGHFSHAYVFLLTLPQRLGLDGMPAILLVNCLLGMAAIAALYAIARSALPSQRQRMDCAILAGTWAVHPLFLASAVFVNVDYGVMVFGLITLAYLLRRRILFAAVGGLFLVFSKETGSLVFAVMLGCYVVLVVCRGSGSIGCKLNELVRLTPLGAVLLAPLVYLTWLRPATVPLWGGHTPSGLIDQLTTLRLLVPTTAAALTGIFVLSFSWIPTSLLVSDLCHRGVAWCFALPERVNDATDPRRLSCVLWIGVFVVFCLTRIQTSVSVRYFAIAYPLLLLASLAATIRLSMGVWLRRATFGCMAALFLASSFRTLDPISKRIYGCFRFGEHQMLVTTAINHECCGYGIDQLVYNLEFVRVHEAVDAAVSWLRPTPSKPIIIADATDWYLFGRMNPQTFRRTLRTPGSVPVPHFDLAALASLAELPPELDYLAVATSNDLSPLERLGKTHLVTGITRFGNSGYWFASYRMTRKRNK